MDLVRQTGGSDLLHHEPEPGNHIGSLKLKGRPMMIFDAMIFLQLDRIFGLRLVDLALTKNPQIKIHALLTAGASGSSVTRQTPGISTKFGRSARWRASLPWFVLRIAVATAAEVQAAPAINALEHAGAGVAWQHDSGLWSAAIMGRSQAVKAAGFDPAIAGSSPAAPASSPEKVIVSLLDGLRVPARDRRRRRGFHPRGCARPQINDDKRLPDTDEVSEQRGVGAVAKIMEETTGANGRSEDQSTRRSQSLAFA